MTKDEALKLALEALESSNKLINGQGTKFGLEGAMDGYYSGCFDVDGNNKLLNEAITAIKEALAQPAQEPVADDPTYTEQQIANACWAAEISDIKYQSLLIALQEDAEPVYSKPAQRPWVGLTDDERLQGHECWRQGGSPVGRSRITE